MSRGASIRQRLIWLSPAMAGVLLSLTPPVTLFAQKPASLVEATTVPAAVPAATAYDADGNLYVALRNDHVVRKIDTLGIITTVAGTGEQGFGGDGGAATSALLDSPSGVALDGAGNIYIADTRNHRIREVINGAISTIAGTGMAGFGGDAGPATTAQLSSPTGVSVDTQGNVYIADTNNQRIRKITSGVIATVAGTGEQGVGGDGGAATSALLDTPVSVVADPVNAGRFFLTDTHNHSVRLVDGTGRITSIAGTGGAGFGGDGGDATAAQLARPRGVALDSNGGLYISDTENYRIRMVSGNKISTIAGDGEQGFAGDTGMPFSAVLDTPRGLAVNSEGTVSFADTHNQRIRSFTASAINTVAGVAPVLTESLLVSGPAAGTYGTAIGTLTATFSNGSKIATGSLALLDGGVQISSSPLSSNADSFDLSKLSGGIHSLAVLYGGDANNPEIASGLFLVSVAKAKQTILFPALTSPVTYSGGLSVPLAATATSGLGVTYTVTGPATVSGSTLTYTGGGTVVVTATQTGNGNYEPVAASQTVKVTQLLVATSVMPASAPVGSINLPITVAGSGFTSTSVIEVNGTPLPTTGTSTLLNAVIPQLTSIGTLVISVHDSASQQQSATLPFSVTAPAANATLTGPPTVSSGQQPTISFQLQQSYPVPITGVLTLTFTPDPSVNLDDPAIQFSTGGRTLTFTIPANSTTVPTVAFQAGTVPGTITFNLTLTAAGLDVTPATAKQLTITIPKSVPSATVQFTQSGRVLTVVTTGFSNTRELSQVMFSFTSASGAKLNTPTLTLPVTDEFATWFSSAPSKTYGSEFLYTQIFNLSEDATIQNVTIVLQNSVGMSAPASSQQ